MLLPAVVVASLLPVLPVAPPVPVEPPSLLPLLVPLEVAVPSEEVVPVAAAVLALVTTERPVPQPVSPAARRPAALTTIKVVLVQRCRRNDAMLERVVCISDPWSELDL